MFPPLKQVHGALPKRKDQSEQWPENTSSLGFFGTVAHGCDGTIGRNAQPVKLKILKTEV
jgi:hypothetical protein